VGFEAGGVHAWTFAGLGRFRRHGFHDFAIDQAAFELSLSRSSTVAGFSPAVLATNTDDCQSGVSNGSSRASQPA
jgi:hypothetical protein